MNELTFLDLVILKKIDSESTVENFGSLINTSFFESANLLGTMKIKGYISIESSIGGTSRLTITDAGNGILALCEQRIHEPIEPLDNAILHALAGGAKELEAMQTSLNIRGADLAYHINKLISQGFMDYSVRSAKVYFVLTEQGFNSTGGVRVQQKLDSEKSDASKSNSIADFDDESGPEETGGQNSETEKIERQKLPQNGAPPWVSPVVVRTAEHKEDVSHILHDDKEEKAVQEKHEARRHEKKKEREMTPEEQKTHEKRKRLLSKLTYYVSEYAPYLLLLVIVLFIFAGAIFLSISKLL